MHGDPTRACVRVRMCVCRRPPHPPPLARLLCGSESYGASIKDRLHRRCCRRRKAIGKVIHKSKKTGKTWRQKALAVSRVMQVFRDEAVAERVLRDVNSHKYLGRKQFKVKEKGFAVAGEGGPKVEPELPQSIYNRIAEGYDFA